MPDDYTPFALVADDDPIIRMETSDILEDAGFRVYEAGSAEEAIEILTRAATSIQLLFTDVQMPPGNLNGFDLVRQCAENWPHISILVASGQIQPKDGELPDGAVFIGKPFSAQVVYSRLQEILPEGAKPDRLKKAAPL